MKQNQPNKKNLFHLNCFCQSILFHKQEKKLNNRPFSFPHISLRLLLTLTFPSSRIELLVMAPSLSLWKSSRGIYTAQWRQSKEWHSAASLICPEHVSSTPVQHSLLYALQCSFMVSVWFGGSHLRSN